jgi:hypothetical protein
VDKHARDVGGISAADRPKGHRMITQKDIHQLSTKEKQAAEKGSRGQ